MRRIVALTLALATAPLPGIAAQPGWHTWTGDAELIANHGVYRDHEFIYNDYVYDDHGANTDGKDRLDAPFGAWPDPSRPGEARLSPTGGAVRHAGDFMYAADADLLMHNVADLIEFRVARDGADAFLHVRFGDMTATEWPVFAACIDTDRLAATGLQTWPHNANMRARLGCEAVVTASPAGATATTPDGSSDLDVRADVDEATLDVRIPGAVLAPAGTWRIWAGSGVYDPDIDGFGSPLPIPQVIGAPVATGGALDAPNVWDLLSNNREPNSYWLEEKQANDLARSWIADDFIDVDFGRLASPHDDPSLRLTGFMERIYVSEHPMSPARGIIAEGPDPSTNFVYLGRYQPYAMVVPSDYWTRAPERFAFDQCLHPLNGNHMVEVYYAQAFGRSDGYNPLATGTLPQTGYLGFSEIEGLVDRLGTLYACVLGRGEGVGYTGGDGLVDALEVQADVIDHYRVDPDRVTIHGVSLGAIGSWYVSQLYPDRFSAVMPYIFSPGIVAGSLPRLRNLYNVPTFYAIGTFDQFAQGTQGDPTADRMEEEGNEYLYVHYLGRQHEGRIESDFLPFTEALGYPRARVTDPARVRYRFEPGAFSAKMPGDGSAYWVRGMTPATSAGASIDVTSLARASQLPTRQVIIDGLYTNTIEGWQARIRGLFRMSEAEFRAMWHPEQWEPGWVALNLDVTETTLPAPAPSNAFTLDASTLSAATLDADGMDLDTDARIDGTLTGDAPMVLTLVGDFSGGRTVTVDGDPVLVATPPDGSALVIPVNLSSPGPHALVIT